ncbi:tetratricopeptide repeat protein [Marinobacter nanhaiticus]|nr:SEL1-like repeat protein [Marinobacter nanhaiticus]
MYRWLVMFVGVILISGCASLKDQDFLASSSDFFDRAGKALGKIGEPTAKIARDAEVQTLFDQSYIDPLTKYLKQHDGDASRAEQLAQVRDERERRCSVIAKRYAARPLTREQVARYRAGYSLSCPEDVEAFALRYEEKRRQEQNEVRLAEAEDKGAEDEEDLAKEDMAAESAAAGSVPSAVSQELNDCFLLTAIRNFSDALEACRTPAENGNVRAQTNMATIAYALQHYDQALDWAKRAAPESGNAANLIGRMYAEGQGVAADQQVARQWFQQAASLGHAGAQATLDSNVKVSAGNEVR